MPLTRKSRLRRQPSQRSLGAVGQTLWPAARPQSSGELRSCRSCRSCRGGGCCRWWSRAARNAFVVHTHLCRSPPRTCSRLLRVLALRSVNSHSPQPHHRYWTTLLTPPPPVPRANISSSLPFSPNRKRRLSVTSTQAMPKAAVEDAARHRSIVMYTSQEIGAAPDTVPLPFPDAKVRCWFCRCWSTRMGVGCCSAVCDVALLQRYMFPLLSAFPGKRDDTVNMRMVFASDGTGRLLARLEQYCSEREPR